MPSILIIGHGYVGTALAQRLRSESWTVSATSRSGDTHFPYPVLALELGDEAATARLRAEGAVPTPDVIVHCASSGRGGAEAYQKVFVDGVTHLQFHFPGAPLILTSSTSVYGQTDGSVVTETSATDPDRETSRLLLAGENLVRSGGGIALRLAGIYGPGRSVYLRKILSGTATIETGPVSRTLNQIHRDDIVGAIIHLFSTGLEKHAGSIFNVCDDTPLTQRECYEGLAERLGLPIPPEAPPELDRKRAWTDKIVSAAALRATGWSCRHPSFLGALETDPTLLPSIRKILEAPDPSEG